MKNSWGVQLTSRTTHVNFIRPIVIVNKYQVRAELFREVVVLLSNICYLLIVYNAIESVQNLHKNSVAHVELNWAHVPQQGGRYLTITSTPQKR
jgi:hypothetical protein